MRHYTDDYLKRRAADWFGVDLSEKTLTWLQAFVTMTQERNMYPDIEDPFDLIEAIMTDFFDRMNKHFGEGANLNTDATMKELASKMCDINMN